MTTPLIQPDTASSYEIKEIGIIVAALAFVIAVGGVALAAIVICGWKGSKGVALNFIKGTASFTCN